MKLLIRASLRFKMGVFILLLAFTIAITRLRPGLKVFVLTALVGIAFATTNMALLREILYAVLI